jgi:CheY-like chemotaxis protein
MTTRSAPPPTFVARRVLVVDDYPDAAEMLADALQNLGHRTFVARDAETALRLCAEFAPDVALLELELPKMNGYELGVELKARCAETLTLIAITGFSGDEQRARAAQSGFSHFLVKPVNLTELAQLLTAEPSAKT